MEENSHFDSFELQFTNQSRDFLATAGKWATFLSIVGFIVLGLMFLGALAMFAMGSALDGMGGAASPMAGMMSGGIIGGIYLVIVILCFFPTLYLFRFGSKAKQAVNNNSTAELTECMGNLKSYFKFLGIFTIATMVFYIILFIVMIAVGVSAATGSM
jgi:hypothetical protein